MDPLAAQRRTDVRRQTRGVDASVSVPHLAMASRPQSGVRRLGGASASRSRSLRTPVDRAGAGLGKDGCMTTLGAVFLPQLPPERLRDVARSADEAGLQELWLWEDCFRE